MARAGLNRQVVVDLALAVVDDAGPRGFADLTLSAVAARAGVAVPSLYKHVAGLPELRRAVALVSVRGLTAAIESGARAAPDPARPGVSELRAVAHAVRTYARTSPGRYIAAQGAVWVQDRESNEVHEAAARAVAALTALLGSFDLPPEDVIDAVRMVRSALHGFVVLELEGGFGMPADVDQSFRYLVDALVAALGAQSRRGPAIADMVER